MRSRCTQYPDIPFNDQMATPSRFSACWRRELQSKAVHHSQQASLMRLHYGHREHSHPSREAGRPLRKSKKPVISFRSALQGSSRLPHQVHCSRPLEPWSTLPEPTLLRGSTPDRRDAQEDRRTSSARSLQEVDVVDVDGNARRRTMGKLQPNGPDDASPLGVIELHLQDMPVAVRDQRAPVGQ